jgi:hypothetical protein
MFTLIALGSYAAQYYTWSVSYQIVPLTETKVVVNMGAHSGATSVPDISVGSFDSPVTYIWVPSGKKLDVYIMVPHDALDQLEQHFYNLTLKIHLKDGVNTIQSEQSYAFPLVTKGSHPSISTEPRSGITGLWVKITYITGTWKVWFELTDIWTGAVTTPTGLISFPIWVYAVEV